MGCGRIGLKLLGGGKSYWEYFIAKPFERKSTMTLAKTNAVGSKFAVDPRLPFAACIVVLLGFGAYAAFVAGPAMRADANIQLDREIAAENVAFCEKFGMRAGTSDFAACSQQLTVVRQKQADRDSAASLGIL